MISKVHNREGSFRGYRDLGVQPFINASGTITTLGGSLMSEDVLKTMNEAARSFVEKRTPEYKGTI